MRTLAVFVVVLGACDLEDPPGSSVHEAAVTICDQVPFSCNNSPALLHYGMHELSLLGAPNAQQIRIHRGADGYPQLLKGGKAYRFDVVKGQIIGRAAGGDLVGAGVVGAELELERATDGVPAFDLHIHQWRLSKYQVGPSADLHLYVFSWHDHLAPADPKQTACNPTMWPVSKFDPELFLGMQPGEMLLFGDDRIDPHTLTVSPDPQASAGWINFGCAGHALAKLDLSGNTRHRQPVDDWEARQATLKVYAGDYCGDGTPFTVSGTPLLWRGADTAWPAQPQGLEARWTSAGAQCVGTPRLAVHPSDVFPDVVAEIKEHCPDRFTVCDDLDVEKLDGATRISANYFP